ncbi:MAG: zf-HC2 domain-containing protein [Limnochordales bacterium]|nr:zf-HC2 domain-containing protein [Limnochordales bacterium]
MTMRRCINPVELSAWVDGEVSLRRSRVIRQHVESCPLCAAEVAGLQRVRQAVRLLAGSETGSGADLWMPGQQAQRRQGRQASVESQRLLKRLRAELTREQARVVWGRGPRMRTGWSRAWPAAACALLLVAGIVGSLRESFRPDSSELADSSAPTSQPVVGGDVQVAPAELVTGSLVTAQAQSYSAVSRTSEGTESAEGAERGYSGVTAAGLPTGEDEGSDPRRVSYTLGEVKLTTDATQMPESGKLALWQDGTLAESRASARAAAVTLHPVGSPEEEEDRVTGELAAGVAEKDREGPVAAGMTVANSRPAAGFADSPDPVPVSVAAIAALSDPASQLAAKPGNGKTPGVRPATVNAVRPASESAGATGGKKVSGKATKNEESPDEDEGERSEHQYQQEHERYAATVVADPVESPEEALIKRVLLATTTP